MKLASYQTPDVRIELHQDFPDKGQGLYVLEFFDFTLLTGGRMEFATAEAGLSEFSALLELWNSPS